MSAHRGVKGGMPADATEKARERGTEMGEQGRELDGEPGPWAEPPQAPPPRLNLYPCEPL